eukprot:Tbor_TRINITY_DN5654_c2_g1::TRINITY_DN5654_c2_g1_i5::g.9340::m.9340
MFIVLVAADIFQNKTNFELAFPSRPSLLELTRQTETAFSNEITIRRPDGVPQHSFHVAKFKAYDEDRNKWVDMISESQLIDYIQLYAFQPANPWHKESPKEIPVAIKPPISGTAINISNNNNSIMAGGSSPMYHGSTAAAGAPHTPITVHISSSSAGLAGGGMRASAQSQMPRNTAMINITSSGGGGGRPAIDAGQEEKVRVVFAEFDLKNHRVLDMEDLKQGFRALGFEFTTETMNDLFQKGDANCDGRISYSEFERFAKLYPIMTDCLYYRSKAFWDEDNMIRELEAVMEVARQAGVAQQEAEAAHQGSVRAVEAATSVITSAENDIKGYNNRLRDLAKDVDNSKREKDRAQKEKYEKESDMAAVRDRERQARQGLADAARDADKHEKKIQSQHQEMLKADDKVKQLEAALAEARRAADRAAQQLRASQGEWDGLKAREKEANKVLDTIVRELPRLEEALRMADTNVQTAADHIRDLDDLARDIARDADEAARRRDASERAAQLARDQEAQLGSEASRARQAAEERDRAAKAMEAEVRESQRQRQCVSAHERQLIEQELRLREQRDTLEEKEGKLRSEAGSFLAGLRSSLATQARSYSRDPSISVKAEYRKTSSNY